jgi:hypothetical protein
MVDIHKPFYTVDKDGRLVVNKNTDNFFEKYKPSGTNTFMFCLGVLIVIFAGN